MKEYNWLPSECAPKDYPIYLHKAHFKTNNGNVISIPNKRLVKNGWGTIGSTHIVGDALKAIPNELFISWFSVAENKYYEGNYILPTNIIQALFEVETIHTRTQQKVKYKRIITGLAPGGLISIWLAGPGIQKEVASFRALENEIEWNELFPAMQMNRKEYVEFILNKDTDAATRQLITAGNIPLTKWKEYQKKYNWELKLTHKDNFRSKTAMIEMVNGEKEMVFIKTNITEFKETAIPNYFRIAWDDKNHNSYASKVYLDKDEIFETFKKLYESEESHNEMRIAIEIDRYNSMIVVFVENKSEKIALKNVKVKIYEAQS